MEENIFGEVEEVERKVESLASKLSLVPVTLTEINNTLDQHLQLLASMERNVTLLSINQQALMNVVQQILILVQPPRIESIVLDLGQPIPQ